MSSIKFHCPHCEKAVESDEKYLGQSVNCPYCNEEIIVDYDLDDVASILDKQHSSANTNYSRHPVNTIPTRPFQFNVKTQNKTATPPMLNSIKSNSNANDETRIPCPFCGEKIIKTAVKCRFCGEKLPGSSYAKHSTDSRFSKKAILSTCILFIVVIGLIASLIAHNRNTRKKEFISKYEPVKISISSLINEGAKLQVLAQLGVNYPDLKSNVVIVESAYRRFVESLSESHKEDDEIKDVILNIERAIRGWCLCLEHFEFRIEYLSRHRRTDYSGFHRKDNTILYDKTFDYLWPSMNEFVNEKSKSYFYGDKLCVFLKMFCSDDSTSALLTESGRCYQNAHDQLVNYMKKQDEIIATGNF